MSKANTTEIVRASEDDYSLEFYVAFDANGNAGAPHLRMYRGEKEIVHVNIREKSLRSAYALVPDSDKPMFRKLMKQVEPVLEERKDEEERKRRDETR